MNTAKIWLSNHVKDPLMSSNRLKTTLLTASFLLLAGTAQAAPSFQLAQTDTTGAAGTAGNTSGNTTETTGIAPATTPANQAVTPPANTTTQQAAPPATTTRVEVHNEAPAANQAPPANINIEMPDAPDVNVVAPAQDSGKETVVERSNTTTIIDDTKPEPQTDNTLLYLMAFGILTAIAVFAVIYGRRRTVIIDNGL
jgi:hypothetical protein